jgi:hypothetical protein
MKTISNASDFPENPELFATFAPARFFLKKNACGVSIQPWTVTGRYELQRMDA